MSNNFKPIHFYNHSTNESFQITSREGLINWINDFTENHNESNFENYISCKETHDDMKTYCERYDCNGVIVRPDKYVYDLINYGENDNLEVVISKVLKSLKEKIDL